MNIEMWIGLRTQVAAAALLLAFGCGDDDTAKPAADGGVAKPGSSGDACSADKVCGDGLVCSAGKCAAGAALSLQVDPAARGCQLALLDTADAKLGAVKFTDAVKGSFVDRAPSHGVAFIAVKDESVASNQISLVVAGSGLPKLDRIHCVDSKGKTLAKATIAVVKP